jgi:hypothetical protein
MSVLLDIGRESRLQAGVWSMLAATSAWRNAVAEDAIRLRPCAFPEAEQKLMDPQCPGARVRRSTVFTETCRPLRAGMPHTRIETGATR